MRSRWGPRNLVECVAGLDVGKASVMACIRGSAGGSPGRRRQQVRSLGTTAADLAALRDWLAVGGVARCVMEATAVIRGSNVKKLDIAQIEALIDEMVNDPKDRHVLAAAVRGGAELLVTENLRDFPAEALSPYDLQAVS